MVPSPIAMSGDAIVQILAADNVPCMSQVLDNSRPYSLSLPMMPGNPLTRRLVFCDSMICAGYSAAQKLMDGVWQNGTYAEYARSLPLVNKIWYKTQDLCLLSVCPVWFGGFSEVDVKPGVVVIIAPATGRYSGAAVAVVIAIGATILAAGWNTTALRNLERTHALTGQLRTIKLIDYIATNAELFCTAAGKADGADGSLLLQAGVGRLRPFGRCVIMGGLVGIIELPYLEIMFKSMRACARLILMVESGLLALGKKAGVYRTEEYECVDIDKALAAAGELTG
ncbi:hypothetical protein BJY04DRAFT_229602 [Aspergillus karnatakaensis]|uniref:uncharacterized protein n=1 Tax=Aspergillus karnatakaensis TaxID=1810916 RepID=UPI003CCD4418